MTTNVTPVVTRVTGGGGAFIAKWSMVAGGLGLPVSYPIYELVSVHAYGTWDTSGKVKMQGVNTDDGTGTFADLIDRSGAGGIEAAVEFASADGFKFPVSDALFVRPKTSADGAGSAIAVTVIALFKPRK